MSVQGDLPLELPEQSARDKEIVEILEGYRAEAEHNRKSGMNPRDDKWRQNLDLYWNRIDFSGKADWQSKNTMPEVPAYVDRFAAALKEALVSLPNSFYAVEDPYDTEHDVTSAIKSMTDVWLSTVGKNQLGQPQDFSTVFEEQVKLGALMAMSSVVLWKDDIPGGRVAIETVDPRNVWLDHTYRSLYRLRRTEVDLADLVRMASDKTSRGKPIYDVAEITRLVGERAQEQQQKRELSGNADEIISERKPIQIDEYLATIVGRDGKLIMDREVAMIADHEYLIRGPEKNPFWHGQDWLVYTSLMPVPMSPYGRSYMEDFGSMAKVFTDLTNLILDAVYMSSMKAYVVVPSMLADPTQINTGMYPNKMWMLADGNDIDSFAKALDLGTIDPGSIQLWSQIKSELSDAAGMNEIGLGQLPDKTHIAATAVAGAQQSSSAILRSVAQTVETRYLDPMLDLVWKTGLQHAKPDDPRMQAAVGTPMYGALITRKRELIKRPVTFQARGISSLIQRQQKLQSLIAVLQIITQNENLLAAFMQRIDLNRFVELLFNLSNVDLSKLEPSQRERMIQSVTQPLAQVGQGGTPSDAGLQAMNGVAQGMGL